MEDIMKQAWANKHMPATISLYSHGVTEDMIEGFLFSGGHVEAFAAYCNGVKPNFETEWNFELGPDEVVYKVRFVVVFKVKGAKHQRITIPGEYLIWKILFAGNNALTGLADIHQPYPSAAR